MSAALVFLASGGLSARDRFAASDSALPKDAQKAAARAEACRHFASEFSGSNSQRDREINRMIWKLRCDRVESDLEKLRFKYLSDAKVLELLESSLK